MRNRFRTLVASLLAACLLALGGAPATGAAPDVGAGATTATSDVAGPAGSAVVLAPIGPKVVRPGMHVNVSVPITSYSRKIQRIWVRLKVRCDTGAVWTGKKFWVTVPPEAKQIYDPGPEVIATRKVRIPDNCVHDANIPPRWDGLYTAQIKIGARDTTFYIGKPFTRANARYNLSLQDGTRSSNYQAHHTMPVKYESWFAQRDLTIHDPRWLRWWCSKKGVTTSHQRMAAEYNRRWGNYIKEHPDASKKALLKFRNALSAQYVYTC